MSLSQQTSLEDTIEKHQNSIENYCQSCNNKLLNKDEPNLIDHCLHVYCKNCIDLMNNQCVPCKKLQIKKQNNTITIIQNKQYESDSAHIGNNDNNANENDNDNNNNNNDNNDDDDNNHLLDIDDYDNHNDTNEFTLHNILTNTLSLNNNNNTKNNIYCTSCKSKEKSIARCIDCCNSLCSNCVTAHQYMKCFDNHKVVLFDNNLLNNYDKSPKQQHHHHQQQQQQQHICKAHLNELLKYYCITCDMPICCECLLILHNTHTYELLNDAENKNIQELYSLLNEAKDKINYCKIQSDLLNNYFSDLQDQYESSRGYIDEIYYLYKSLLDKKRVILFINIIIIIVMNITLF
jgi:uncharacterized protein (DUF2344 family)